MTELGQEIQTAFEAISLVLVFIAVLFDLRYEKIQRDIDADIPPGPDGRERLRKRLWHSLLANCGPLLLINGAASYLFSPLFVRVLRESRLDWFHFEFSYTSFVLISLVVFLFFLWSGFLAVQLIIRIVRTRRRD